MERQKNKCLVFLKNRKKELLKYLAKRPYIEVAGLVAMIASLEPVKKENGKDKAQ